MFAEAHLYPGVALAGLVSFLSPCVLPLVPPYLGYLGGTSLDELADEKGIEAQVHRRVIFAALCFVLGFSTVFVLLGASASLLGQFLQTYREQLSFIAGLVIIAFGLHFVGLLRVPLLYQEARYHHHNSNATFAGAYLMGLAFAFGWTPCIGPILSTVLALAANEGTLGAGMRLLMVYSIGLGVPFVLAAVAIRPFLTFMNHFRAYLGRVEMVMGIILILTGIAFLNIFEGFSITALGQWLIETFPGLSTLETWITPQGLQDAIRNQQAPGQ